MSVIAISGGIGSGKSVVSRILTAMGYPVYDCDSEAKRIMNGSPSIKSFIKSNISDKAILADQSIDRIHLAEVVFKNQVKLEMLNSVVHDAVKTDVAQWVKSKSVSFVETAILYQSGLDKLVNQVWEIVAPDEIRINRVMKRNRFSAEQVKDRIKSQDGFVIPEKHPETLLINNDGLEPVLPVILSLLKNLQK
ncbi:MAG: dephospho-CoA kinase [Paramuribaculum sp.]|nr:dephospho-CoA kinase [Paramuribaculum sp.]MDE5835676.1 dephospho-CoA kinase [Paramuribaculum sp.]